MFGLVRLAWPRWRLMRHVGFVLPAALGAGAGAGAFLVAGGSAGCSREVGLGVMLWL